jgi:hypothetical protein
MRNLLLAGTAAGVLIFVTVSAASADNPNALRWPPYASSTARGHAARDYRHARGPVSGLSEGRAVYEGEGGIYGRPGNDYGPGFDYPSPASPYKWAASPEDFH